MLKMDYIPITFIAYSFVSFLFFFIFDRDESEVVIHSDDAFAPVGFLRFKKMHLQDKEQVRN